MSFAAIVKKNADGGKPSAEGGGEMSGRNIYTLTLDGVAYVVEMEYADGSGPQTPRCGSRQLGTQVEPVKQAPWVTARRVAHLPAR